MPTAWVGKLHLDIRFRRRAHRTLGATFSPMKKWAFWVYMFVGTVGWVHLLVYFVVPSFVEAYVLTSSYEPPLAPVPLPAPREWDTRIVTLLEYSQLRTGFTYEEACATIGAAGTEMSRNEMQNVITVMYSWKNDDGSNMNAMFQDDGLIQKAQFGLK